MMLRKALQNSPIRDASTNHYIDLGILAEEDSEKGYLFDLLTAVILEQIWMQEVMIPTLPFLTQVLENQIAYTHQLENL